MHTLFHTSIHNTHHTTLDNSKHEGIVDRWLFVRYMVIGTYVGVVTVMGFVWWFLWYEVRTHAGTHVCVCVCTKKVHIAIACHT